MITTYAQINCRYKDCRFNIDGICNIYPTITLNHTGKFTCWSSEIGDEQVKVIEGKKVVQIMDDPRLNMAINEDRLERCDDVPYSAAEKEQQLVKMRKLGLVGECTFEQAVNLLIDAYERNIR